MGKLIVLPPPESVATNRVISSDSPATRKQAAEILAARREKLHAFAARAAKSGRKYQVLEGIGALVMEEDEIDRKYLKETLGAGVYENKLIGGLRPSAAVRFPTLGPPDFWHLEKINLQAFRKQSLTGAGVVVGVLDSGIQASHPEFADKKIHFAHFDQDGNQTDTPARDFGNHGTHVSGLIAGKHIGVAPDATLAVAAVLTEKRGQACHHAAILAGLDWLIKTDFTGNQEPGCPVINTSLQIRGFNDFLYGTLAIACQALGTLMVAASGNHATANPQQPSTPGNYDIVIGVGATDQNDQVAPFSQWGKVKELGGIAKPDLCAPGVNIWSSIPTNGYQSMSGTSMASPLVCGAIALLLQQKPDLANDLPALKEALLNHTLELPEQQEKAGRGRLLFAD